MVPDPRQSESLSGLLSLVSQWSSLPYRSKILGLSCLGAGAIAVGAGYYGHRWADEQGAPLIESRIQDLLNRPVSLGNLKSVSLTHIEFGATTIASTEQDPNWVKLQGLRIGYNPLQYLGQRQLALTITAIKPRAYVEQGRSGAWLQTEMDAMGDNSPLRFNALIVEDAQGSVVTRQPHTQQLNPPVPFQLQGAHIARHGGEGSLTFALDGRLLPRLHPRSRFAIRGTFNQGDKSSTIQVQARHLAAAPLRELLPLPLDLRGGTLNGNLAIAVRHQALVSIEGRVDVEQGTLKLPQLERALTDINGPLIFQGQTIQFGNIQAKLDQLHAQGTGYLDWRQGFQLAIATRPLGIDQIFQALTFPPSPVRLGGQLSSQIQIQGALANPDVRITLQQAGNQPVQIEKLSLKTLQADLQVTNNQVTIHRFNAIPQSGGAINGSGQINRRVKHGRAEWQPFQLRLNAQALDAHPWLPSQFKPQFPRVLPLSGHTTVQGELADPTTWHAQANVTLPLGGGTIQSQNFTYHGGRWQGDLQLQQVSVTAIAPKLPALIQPALHQGQISARLKVQGRRADIKQIIADGQAQVSVPQGELTIPQFQLQQGQWQATVKGENLPTYHPLPRQGQMSGQIVAQGNLNQRVDQWQLSGSGQWRSPQGNLKITAASLENQQFEAHLSTPGLAWQHLNIAQPGQLQGNLTLAGTWRGTPPELRQVRGNLTSTAGWRALTDPLQVAFDWRGNTLNLKHLRSQGLNVQGQLTVPVESLQPGFDFAQNIQHLALHVDAQQLPVGQLLPSPSAIAISGQLNFQGRVTGTGTRPNLQGQLAIAGLQVGDYSFSPWLSGPLQSNAQGLHVSLQGEAETLHLALDDQQTPTSVVFKRQDLQLTGVRQGEQLSLTAQALPLNVLQASLPTVLALAPPLSPDLQAVLNQVQQRPLAGELSGDFQLDLAQKTAIGSRVKVKDPRWGAWRGNDLTANFQIDQHQFTLNNSRLRYGESTVLLQGSLNWQGALPAWAGAIRVRNSRIEEILAILHLFDWQDLRRGLQLPTYAQAKDLYEAGQNPDHPLISVGDGAASLDDQFNQLAASQAQLAQHSQSLSEQLRGITATLPKLAALKGKVEGNINLHSNGLDPIAAQFQLSGQDWQWGESGLEQLTLAGHWQGQTLSITPLELRSGDRFLRISGEWGPTAQTGQLQLQAVPLKPLARLFNLPDHLQPMGNVFADFRLGGTRVNPQLQGNLHIQDGGIQNILFQQTTGDFRYQSGRLGFQLQSLVNHQTEPLILEGSVPYVFPFASQLPESDQFSVALRLKNDGLSLLNLVPNPPLTWLRGEGNVNLRLLGRLDPQTQTLHQLQGLGDITLKDTAIATPWLPHTPITEINGRLLADLNTLQVVGLTGKLSGGDVTLGGTLPLQNPLLANESPLQLQFNHLAVDLPNLYRGAMAGTVDVTGTVIAPQIGGQLTLTDGTILLGNVPTLAAAPSPQAQENPLKFHGLTLNLADNVRVQNLPFLDFGVAGSLRLFGPLDRLQPQGTIALTGGQVNLFASQLRLDNGQTNTVSFLPEKGIDPYLKVHLMSSASETRRNHGLTRSPLSSEIDEPFQANQESLQTVRIKAQIRGHASDLKESIQLSSTPRRSEHEIITLLGGGFINTLGQDNIQTTVGLTNLAGSAVLGTLQGQIGDALGLSEFRIFSTPLAGTEDQPRGDQIGVAAEASIDLTPQFGVSIQKVINADRPPEWGLRYRINENTLIRGSSNFQDDSRGMIEFQQRF